MSNRATRREILAAIVLANELPAPNEICFRVGLSVTFDSVANLRAWLPFFCMTEEDVRTQPFTRLVNEVEQTSTLANASSGRNWRGWRLYLSALDPVGAADRPLDDDTRAALAEVAAGGETA